MRFRWLSLAGLLLAAVLFASNRGGRAQVPPGKTWQYKVVTAQYTGGPPLVSEEEMNRLGAEGWELVDTRSSQFKSGELTQHRTDYFFKRPR